MKNARFFSFSGAGLDHTSREAKRETTPIGMKTMLTSIKADMTCITRKPDLTKQFF